MLNRKLKRIETKMMILFLHRQGMYIHPINRDTVVSFMHGVDFGKRSEPHWTSLLNDFISTKEKINGGAMGWPNQVEIYCKKKNIAWTEAFKQLMLQLIEESEQIPYSKKLKTLNQKFE